MNMQPTYEEFYIHEAMGISKADYDDIVTEIETLWDSYKNPFGGQVIDFVTASVQGRCIRDVVAGFVISQIVEENDQCWDSVQDMNEVEQ